MDYEAERLRRESNELYFTEKAEAFIRELKGLAADFQNEIDIYESDQDYFNGDYIDAIQEVVDDMRHYVDEFIGVIIDYRYEEMNGNVGDCR